MIRKIIRKIIKTVVGSKPPPPTPQQRYTPPPPPPWMDQDHSHGHDHGHEHNHDHGDQAPEPESPPEMEHDHDHEHSHGHAPAPEPVEIYPLDTPNPNAYKFTVSKKITEKSFSASSPKEAAGNPLAEALLSHGDVASVFGVNDFITVTKKNDSEFYVKFFSLDTYECVFQERIGGRPEQYIKLREV